MTLKVHRFSELAAIFEKLPAEIAKGAGNDGVRGGAKIVLAAAKALVPVKSGNLRDSLEVKKVRAKYPVYKVQASRTGGKKGFHAWLVELGTKPHTINPKKEGGKLAFAGGVFPKAEHRGSKKQPFLRPALLNEKEEVVKEISEKILKSINRRLKKFLK